MFIESVVVHQFDKRHCLLLSLHTNEAFQPCSKRKQETSRAEALASDRLQYIFSTVLNQIRSERCRLWSSASLLGNKRNTGDIRAAHDKQIFRQVIKKWTSRSNLSAQGLFIPKLCVPWAPTSQADSLLPCSRNVSFQTRFTIISYPVLSHPILSYTILFYPVLYYTILSYPILSYLAVSYQ